MWPYVPKKHFIAQMEQKLVCEEIKIHGLAGNYSLLMYPVVSAANLSKAGFKPFRCMPLPLAYLACYI